MKKNIFFNIFLYFYKIVDIYNTKCLYKKLGNIQQLLTIFINTDNNNN